MNKNKTITPFVFAAALLVAMLASTGIAHAQGTPRIVYTDGQTAIEGDSFEVVHNPSTEQVVISFTPLQAGTYTAMLDGASNTASVTNDAVGDQVSIFFSTTNYVGNAVLSFGGSDVVEQIVLVQAPPTIVLSGPLAGNPDDRITRNRGIDITLASDFDVDMGDTWGISVDGGADNYARTKVDNADNAPNLHFGLGDGIYEDDQVRVRQTVNGVTSTFAGLAAFTFDRTAPTIALNGAASITLKVGESYTDLGATVTDNLDAAIQSKLVVGGDTVSTATPGTYTITYDATDHADNTAAQVTREVVVPVRLGVRLGFAAGGEPVLTSNGVTTDGVTYAKEGDTLTLTFTVNQALASSPTVTIDGMRVTANPGGDNEFIATHSVRSRVVEFGLSTRNGVPVRYDIDEMAADGDTGNTFDPDEAEYPDTILIDVAPAAVAIPKIPRGVVSDLQRYDITFLEPVTGLEVGDFSDSTGLTVSDVSPVSGPGIDPGTQYTITFTPNAETFTFAVDGGSVTDVAGNPSPASTTSKDGFADPATNTPPTAEAGPAQRVDTGASVTLDGSGSSDPDGTIESYAWTQDSGTIVALTGADTAGPTFTAPDAATTLVFSLIVTDNDDDGSTADTVVITVSDPAADNTAPMITFNRFEQTGGVEVGTGTFLNAGDTLTAFVNSDEPLAESSLVGAAFFGFEGSNRPVQNLLRVAGTTDPYQYSTTYTIITADHDAEPQFNVRGVTDTADTANTASDFRHPFLGTVTIDTVAPTITLVGGPVTVAHGGTYTDAEDAGISGAGRSDTTATTTRPDATTVDGIVVDTNTAGDYTITYTATDRAGNVSNSVTRTVTVSAPAGATNTAPVITFDRFEHTGGVEVGTGTFLNAGDTLTAFVNSDEPLAESSLVGAAFFGFDTTARPVQNLLRVGDTNQYSATYTITPAEDDTAAGFNVRGVTDTADPANTASDFRHPFLGTVTIDTVAPTITLVGGPVTVAHGGTYTDAEDAGISGAGRSDTTATTTRPDSMIVSGIVVDTNTAGDYTITYTATDRAGNVSNSVTRTVTVSAPTGATNTAPVVSGEAAPNYAENADVATTPVATYATTDTNTIAWSVGGTDASLFAIDPTSGVLTFRASPNFEDAHGPTYSINITATETDDDPNNLTGTQAVTVTVTNVDEDGTATIAGTAKVDVMLTASVTDPDGAVTGVTHAWQSAPDGTNTYTTISGAGTDAAYTPGVDDVGKTIQVIATYTDPQGSGKMATSTPTAAVQAADALGPAPGIALERDTAADGGVNTDRFTRNRGIAVTLASGFGDNAANTWQWSINNGDAYTTVSDHNVERFVLPNTSDAYTDDQVRVRQTVNSVVSAFAGLAAFTIDSDAPTVILGSIAGAVIDQGGQTHAITFSENVFGLAATDFSTSTGIDVTAVSGSGAAYTITYTATAADFTLTLAAGSVTDLVAWSVDETSQAGTATAANTAPTAEAGDDQEVLTGAAPVTLSGSGTDDDGTIASYAWTQDSGTTVTLSSTTTAAPTFTAPDAATDLVFSLIVTDNDGANSAADMVTITVSAPPVTNQPPVVSGNAAPNYAENTPVTTPVATYTTTDTNTIAWSVTGTDASLFAIDTNGALTFKTSPDFEDAHAATYSITITATETDGDPSNLTGTQAVTVTVTNVDEEGSIGAITGTAQVGVALTAGMVTDPDGAVTGITYQWQSVESGVTTNIGTGMTYTPGVGDEGKTIQVIATYTDPQGSGKMATSAATAAVIAAPVTNQPPVANAGLDQRNVDTGAMVTLDGSGSTGDELEYAWAQNTGATVTLSSTTVVSPTFTAPALANDLTFTLTVTDSANVTATDTVRIFVTASNAFRIALADDTGIDGDGITRNGVVNVSNPGGSWRYATDGTTFFTIQTSATTSFTLPEGRHANVVATQVGDSDGTAELGAVTVDSTAPTVETFVTTIAPGVIGTAQMHDITFSEALDFASTDITAAGATVDSVTTDDRITHTITFTPTLAAFSLTLAIDSVMDIAGNDGPAAEASASGTANQPPTAEAGPPQTGVTGMEVALASSGTDPDGNDGDLTYSWELTTGTGITLSDDNSANPTFTPVAAGTYTFTLTVTDDGTPEGSATDAVVITVQDALAFDTAPALTTSNTDAQRAKDGDTLTLTFTVNQALASVPVVVTIAGQPITPTGTAGNVYTATYTVVAAEVTDEGAVVSYSTGRLTAAGPAGNTAQITDDSAIRIDLTAPTIALTGGDAPVVLTVGGTYTEPGATATDNVDASVPTPTPSGTVDPNTPADYTITYTATDRAGNVATRTRTVTVSVATATRPVVVAPVSPITFAEGATGTVATFTATPSTGRTIASWAVGGADRGDFSITTDGTTNAGILTFNTRPDFETKSAYSITVIATDNGGEASEARAVTVTVTNVDEEGSISAITGTVQVGQTLTAGAVTDPDGAATGITYQWQRVPSSGAPVNIGADQDTYNVVVADLGATLRVVVSYSDGVGTADTATSAPTATVIAAGATPMPGIALAMDTGSSASDGITSNGLVNVPLASDFETETDSPDSWDYSTNGGGSYTDGTNPTTDPLASSLTASFDLGSLADATYQLRVRQTIGGTRSAPASLQVTLDRTAPTVIFGDITAVIDKEQTHPIIFSEAVDFVSADITAAGATVNSVALDSGSDRAYTITFTPNMADFSLTLAADSVMDIAGNDGPAAEARASGTETVASTPPPAPANRNPVAEAGPAQSVETGVEVTLDGSMSSDPDGTIARYAWTHTLTGGSAPATPITVTGADTAGPTFTPVAAGTYTFTLTVTDAGTPAASHTDTVVITVTVPANRLPVADAGPAQSVETGVEVTLDGSMSSDPDGTIARYAWTQDSGTEVTLSDPTAARPTFTAPDAAGELVFTLTVTDDADSPASNTATVIITVTRPLDTVAPVITLLGDSPLDVNQGATYTDPGATASDDRDGELSAGIIVGGDTVDTDTIGAYTVTYDVSDAADNAAVTVTRIVRVVAARDLTALNEAILPEVARDIADQNVSAITRRLEQARLPSRVGSSASLGGASSLAEIAKSQGGTVADGQFDLQRLMSSSNFVLPLSATDAGAADGGTQLTLWGAGDYRDLKGADGVRWSGDLFSLQLGLDAHLNERTILGVSVSKSQVELDYTTPGPAAGGNYDLDITSVHPYLGWTAGGLDFWATLGYGEGELEISADGAQTDIPSSDLSMQTLGLGANGVLMETGTTTLLLKTEILSTQLEVDASEGITAITQQAHRARMTLEAIRGFSLESGARLETSLEAGLRYDGGDGTTGAGAELGGGLRYASHSGGLVIEGKARALVGGKGDTEEWGLSGLITYNPAANGRGLSFSLTPSYGATTSGVERLWQQGLDDGLEAQGGNDGYNYTPNLNLRLDYGMDVSAMPGLVTPYTEFSFGATGDTYRLGLQWQRSKWFDLKLVAERKAGQITADHRIYLEGEIVF